MMLVILVFGGLIGSSLAAGAVNLRPYNVTAAFMFAANDKNGDGILTKTEFEAVFHADDRNGDGVLERHEYVCMITETNDNMAYVAHAIYDDYDDNGDHRLDQSDFDALFKKMDANGDGEVSSIEFILYWIKLLEDTEHYSIHGNPHPHHHDKYCDQHHPHKGR